MQLYLDCDGVLADFDSGATELLGMPPRVFEKRRGLPAFWREIARHPDFSVIHFAAECGGPPV